MVLNHNGTLHSAGKWADKRMSSSEIGWWVGKNKESQLKLNFCVFQEGSNTYCNAHKSQHFDWRSRNTYERLKTEDSTNLRLSSILPRNSTPAFRINWQGLTVVLDDLRSNSQRYLSWAS